MRIDLSSRDIAENENRYRDDSRVVQRDYVFSFRAYGRDKSSDNSNEQLVIVDNKLCMNKK